MNEILLIIWIIVWVILLAMSTVEKKGIVFGFMAGLWITFLGIYIMLDGLQLQSGMTVTGDIGDQTIIYQYSEIVPPFSSYSTLWCIPFILIGMYVMYLSVNALRRRKNNS